MRYENLDGFLDCVKRRNPGQDEFHQSVGEVMAGLWPFVRANPGYAEHGLLDRLIEPERLIQFRVC